MKDIMELACESRKQAKTSLEYQNRFTEWFLEELCKINSQEIATCLTCVYAPLENKYIITLKFPADVTFDKMDAIKGDVK